MESKIALFDANVLYPSELRSFLMYLALTGLFRAKWTARISPADNWNALATLMDAHSADALVTGFEQLIPALNLPDAGDRHVMAAAIRCRADIIVTMNLRDFPASALAPFSIEAQHPDIFVSHLIELDPKAVAEAAESHRSSLQKPSKSTPEYLDTLARQGLTHTVSLLRVN